MPSIAPTATIASAAFCSIRVIDVRQRREARIDDGEDDGEEDRRHDDGIAAERGAEAARHVDECLADRLGAFAAALDQPARHHGGKQKKAGRRGLPCARARRGWSCS